MTVETFGPRSGAILGGLPESASLLTGLRAPALPASAVHAASYPTRRADADAVERD